MTSQIIVIKYGGAAMQTPSLIQTTMHNIVHLKTLGLHPLILHGGGPEISSMCQKMGIAPTFENGVRVTDRETLEIAQMVLIGKINKELVSYLNQAGGNAVGLSGHDTKLMVAKQANPTLGFVGEIEEVNPEILFRLMHAGCIPVIAPIATSKELQSYNINADRAAASIAIALNADHLIFLTDVAGVLKDSVRMDSIKATEIDEMIRNGDLQGGMIPKMQGAFHAIEEGVNQVHILDGRIPNVLLLHFQGHGIQGTTIHA
jgi:acetylglutamate kinase